MKNQSTTHFLNRTEVLFQALNRLQSINVSVINIEFKERITILSETPSREQINDLGHQAVRSDRVLGLEHIEIAPKIDLFWSAKPNIREIKEA